MATHSLSGSDTHLAAVLTSVKGNNECVTPSSSNKFSTVMHAVEQPANSSDTPTAATNTPSSPKTVSATDNKTSSAPAADASAAATDSAATMLNTLQASRQLDTSLQVNNSTAATTVSDTASETTTNETTSEAEKDATQSGLTSLAQDVASFSTATAKTTVPNKDGQTQNAEQKTLAAQTSSSDGVSASLTSTSATLASTSATTETAKVESVATTDEQADVQTETSSAVNNAPLSSENKQPLPAAKGKVAATGTAQTASQTAEEMQDTVASTQDTKGAASVETEKTSQSKTEKKSKPLSSSNDKTPVGDAMSNLMGVQLAGNAQNVAAAKPVDVSGEKSGSPSDETAMPAEIAGIQNNKNSSAVASSVLTAGQQKPQGDSDDNNVTNTPTATGDLDDGSTVKGEDEKGSSTAHVLADASGKSDIQTLNNTQVLNENTAIHTLSAHGGHEISLTGNNGLSSTNNTLADAGQSLHGIHEQLPAMYTKNGQIDEHELSARVMLMVGQKWQEAELQLEPQNMGKVQIKLTIDQEQQASVQFMVQHAQTKEALEQSMPRLRELLTQHGLQPGQTQVQQQNMNNGSQSWSQQMAGNQFMGQQSERGSGQPSGQSSAFANNDENFVQTVTVSASQAEGIDFYA
ncbi:flagellar hook-length control protein FliK [Tolumonas lignilytica]|uniref:flagellar hook-length control protein FliK n=1 Tax=Tolumonas lignilytica TaxID=1283284 RepID=UPI0009DD9DFA|nr:flagellar hook-length control protein FliK [Tolumonas lignilytica]